ncbi:uncharacterized protein LOC143916646 [Arctopsyche grandis]|uniref:uncharacterized protein LOC143916646 n=1 Tax=Arctopsyche grandis TaxID=121162 RepID=UPI00406D7353
MFDDTWRPAPVFVRGVLRKPDLQTVFITYNPSLFSVSQHPAPIRTRYERGRQRAEQPSAETRLQTTKEDTVRKATRDALPRAIQTSRHQVASQLRTPGVRTILSVTPAPFTIHCWMKDSGGSSQAPHLDFYWNIAQPISLVELKLYKLHHRVLFEHVESTLAKVPPFELGQRQRQIRNREYTRTKRNDMNQTKIS